MLLKDIVKNFLPPGLVKLYSNKRIKKQTGKIALSRKGYFTDLTDRESYALLAFLLDLERSRDSVHYLEVGIWKGGTIKFLKMNTTRVHFTGIDLFEDFKLSDENTHICETFKLEDVRKSLGNSVELIKGDSAHILCELQRLKRSFDMIFIDGNHTYEATKADFENCIPLLKNGGHIAFHNCSTGFSPDYTYVARDGGPWKVTQEVRKTDHFRLEIEVDRLKVFSYYY